MTSRRITGLLFVLWAHSAVLGQAIQCGDGTDGELTLTAPGIVEFDPDDHGGLKSAYNFTSITIGPDTTVVFPQFRSPVRWLATGPVTIDGTLDLDGQPGHPVDSGMVARAIPGPGGFAGGVGARGGGSAEAGQGPGGGSPGRLGSGGGFADQGGDTSSTYFVQGGDSYGNDFALPLLGGSGGGGASEVGEGAGGGAGGGAVLIATCETFRLDGVIQARGGAGGNGFTSSGAGGGGSGGTIRLLAASLEGTGFLRAGGGPRGASFYSAGQGSRGRIRLEALRHDIASLDSDVPAVLSAPGPVEIPSENVPVRITNVAGVPVPAETTGGYPPADVEVQAAGEVAVEVVASGIPDGTTVTVTAYTSSPDQCGGQPCTGDGTLAGGTATVLMTVPAGFSRFTVTANLAP